MSNTDFIYIYKNEEQRAGERDFSLLRYWFRSVEKNASWVNHIYFVTEGDVPSWLDLSQEKLTVVCYEDFMPEDCLPTVNLNAVTLNLHRIEGLMEQFVIFDSSTFFLRRIREKHLFRRQEPTDSAILDIPSATFGKDIEPHVILNNAGVINEHFEKKAVMKRFRALFFSRKYGVDVKVNRMLKDRDAFSGFAIFPIPYCLNKSVYERVWATEHRLLETCSKQPKPTKRDFDFHLMRAWNICEGRFRPLATKDYCIGELGTDDIDAICSVIRRHKCRVIGLNDATDENEFAETKEKLQEAFAQLFPEPSAYEKAVSEDMPELIRVGKTYSQPVEEAAVQEIETAEQSGENFEDDDDDFYELTDIIEENMGTKVRAELIEKMRVGNRRRRRVKRKIT